MGRFKLFFLALVAVASLLLGGCGDDNNTIVVVPYNGKFIYANNDAAVNSVSAFAIRSNGTLVELAGSPFATGGAGSLGGYYASNKIALARTKKLLFASNAADSTVTVYAMNSATGELAAIGLPVASGGTMGSGGTLAVDANENFLFVGNSGTNNISVFAIAADGTLTPVPASPFTIGAGIDAAGLTLNSVGSTLYIGAPVANLLVVMDVAADGSLTPVAGSPFAFDTNSFALVSSTLAVGGTAGGIISSYNIDSNGDPVLLDSLTVAVSNNQCVSATRRGSLAILSGGNTNGISMVNLESNGTLSLVAGSPFPTSTLTSGYAIANPSGKFLYATESDFAGINQIEAFVIDSAGALTTLGTYALDSLGYTTSVVIY
jgi:6-phosphogluconolactonase (cycloisomerase 2 family)